ncbi:class I SAM-dependent methyltransferase [Sphingobium sp. CR28]|uniref:class I SAM-dependent methyltransferase n=1 Tax=Sphingobium sp. CR28 TaxID=3400272 RepID=UPI003FF061CB
MAHQLADQAEWTAGRGNIWMELQPMLDRLFSPFEAILVNEIVALNVQSVLDIGCGAGGTSLAMAQYLKGNGVCTGVDISPDLIDLACRRAAKEQINARFLCGDAQRCGFSTGHFDAIVSRFGVMFFDDPVAAFMNIRHAAKPGAVLRCIVWRSIADNPFMAIQPDAIAQVLGPQAAPRPYAPRQFAFASDERVKEILADAGWHDVDIQPIDVPCELPANELPIYARRMGGMEATLGSLEGAQSSRLQAALDAEFARFVIDDVARFDAACWMVRATCPSCS